MAAFGVEVKGNIIYREDHMQTKGGRAYKHSSWLLVKSNDCIPLAFGLFVLCYTWTAGVIWTGEEIFFSCKDLIPVLVFHYSFQALW